MPGALELITVLAVLAMALVYGYVAYSAVSIGHTLSDRLYRRQAEGMAAITIIIAALTVGILLVPTSTSGLIFIAAFSLFYATFIGFYYWIDASIRAARLTDPLVRDTLHWSKLRVGFWAYDIGAYIVFFIVGLLSNVTYTTSGSGPILIFILMPLFIMIFAGVIVLPIAAHRSKDKVLKRHLDWFGVYVIVIMSFVFIWSGFVNATNLETTLVTVAGGYLLYRSAKSLVPLYRFKAETIASE